MSYTTNIPFNKRAAFAALALILWLAALPSFGQAQQSTDVRELVPTQTLECEMAGAETHRYKFNLQANEFFQARVEQNGVDVTLRLLDASSHVLAMMDSPNGIEGPETLSFVPEKAGSFVLEVAGLNAKAEKGNYSIRRESARMATAKNKRRMEVERLFDAGMIAREAEGQVEAAIKLLTAAQVGWKELTAQQVRKLRQARAKVVEDRYRIILVTPDTQVDAKTEIKAKDLNDKIEKFRATVQQTAVDPRPLGKELYDILWR